jgi:hypothetical protein
MNMSGQNGGRNSGGSQSDHPDWQNSGARSSGGGFEGPSQSMSMTTYQLRQGSINITA